MPPDGRRWPSLGMAVLLRDWLMNRKRSQMDPAGGWGETRSGARNVSGRLRCYGIAAGRAIHPPGIYGEDCGVSNNGRASILGRTEENGPP